MCGLIVSSDSAFFEKLSPEDTKRFFEESKAFLADFVGAENVVSAMVHMDEKTPHMHFMHVPVTPDGRLNAKSIYTRESLKKLQTELPRHLQSRGFDLQRGVEQEPGAKKKHLDTREFKQQREALRSLEKEAEAVSASLEQRQREEAALVERLQTYERQAREAEKELANQSQVPQASIFNYKDTLETARRIIERQNEALATKRMVSEQNEKQRKEMRELYETVDGLHNQVSSLQRANSEGAKKREAGHIHLMEHAEKLRVQLEDYQKFFRWCPEANQMHIGYVQMQREEAQRRAAEQKRQAEEQARRQEEERARQAQEQERQKALEAERQREEREAAQARQLERRSRGMGMGL